MPYDRLTPATIGAEGEDIAFARRVLKMWPENAPMDHELSSALRGVQMGAGLEQTGLLDEATYRELDRIVGWRTNA